jgi:cytoskeletal protein CcmA (bactofilin family)
MITLFKVKAGALQFTMFIVIVIAILLAGFILLINTHNRFKIQSDFVIETVENANKGIDYVLKNEIPLNDSVPIRLNLEDYKTVKGYRDYWGIFEKVLITSTIKTNCFKKVCLIGALQPKKDRIALYIEDNNKPLVVVGNTKIEGLSYLPKQGVRTGNISGNSYYGNELIYGNKRISNQFPKLSKESLRNIKAIRNNGGVLNTNQYLELDTSKKSENSFLNQPQIIFSHTDINLSGVSLTGHIIVESKTKIIVDSSSKLIDVVLVAPKIEVKANSKGTFQALATKEITVGRNCSFNYPSALILTESIENNGPVESGSGYKDTSFIKIGKGTSFKGVIVYISEAKNYKAQVFIDEKTTVTGEIYCNRNLELLGSVNGSVFTSNFMANQSGSSYQNHIYNATVRVNYLAEEYVGLPFDKSKKGVVAWLY